MSDPESDAPLWKLLGHASRTEPSPRFVRQVVREARALAVAKPSLRERLQGLCLCARRPLLASGTLALLAAVAAAVLLRSGGPVEPGLAPYTFLPLETSSEAFDPASEMAAVEYLGQLMAVADPGLLDDDALASLF